MLALLIALLLTPAEAKPKHVRPDPDKAETLRSEALTAYLGHDFGACSDRFVEALKYGPESAGESYNAACCAALAGRDDEAFARLDAAVAAGFTKADDLAEDPDLGSLKVDARWDPVLAKVRVNQEAWLATLNPELYELYRADQGDRRAVNIDSTVVGPRDAVRRARVAEIIAAGGAKASIDWYHAAMVYQHGTEDDDIRKAHEYALQALAIEPVHEPARWLAAASEDRLLMREGKPQKWGTQYVRETEGGPWVVYEVDPTVTDEERAKWNVPPLAESRRRAEAMNAP